MKTTHDTAVKIQFYKSLKIIENLLDLFSLGAGAKKLYLLHARWEGHFSTFVTSLFHSLVLFLVK